MIDFSTSSARLRCARAGLGAWLWVAAPAWLCACTAAGTETDNPLANFQGTECKSGETTSALTLASTSSLAQPATGDSAPDPFVAGPEYDGLFCVAWDASDAGDLRIDLYNYPGGCHVDWIGHARASDEGLNLELEVAGCRIAGCGGCIYDLSFELRRIDVAAPLPLAVAERSCSESPDAEIAELTLPLDERRSGVLCRPDPDALLGLQVPCGRAHLGVCDSEFMSATSCSEPGAPACADGLACATVGEHDVCLTACSADAHCPLAIERCDEGVCRLRETF
jgi:hypothetical protein